VADYLHSMAYTLVAALHSAWSLMMQSLIDYSILSDCGYIYFCHDRSE